MRNKFILMSLLASVSFGLMAGISLNEKASNVTKATVLDVDSDGSSSLMNEVGDIVPGGSEFSIDEPSDEYQISTYQNGELYTEPTTYFSSYPFTLPTTAPYWLITRLEPRFDTYGYACFVPMYAVSVLDWGGDLISWEIMGDFCGTIEGVTYVPADEHVTFRADLNNNEAMLVNIKIDSARTGDRLHEIPSNHLNEKRIDFLMPYDSIQITPTVHAHNFDIEFATSNGNKVYVDCKNENCPLENSKAVLCIDQTSNLRYTGQPIEPENVKEVIFEFIAITHAQVDVFYYEWDGEKEVGNALDSVTEPGTYVMWFRVSTAIGKLVFTVDKADPNVTGPNNSISVPYGLSLGEIIANNTSNITEGTWSVDDSDWMITPDETREAPVSVVVTFTPTDTAHYNELTFTTEITVTKGTYTPEQDSETIHIGNYVGQSASVTIPFPMGFGLVGGTLVNPNPEYFDFQIDLSKGNAVTITVLKEFERSLGESFTFTLSVGGSALYDDYTYTITLEPTWHTHGATGETINGSNPSCISTGTKSYYKCECGFYYTDSTCTTLIGDDAALATWLSNPEGGLLAELGHDWTEVTYLFDKNSKSWTASRQCLRDSEHVESETVAAVKENGMWVGRFTNSAFQEQAIKAGLGGGAIAGIVIGCFFFVVIAAYTTLNILYNKKGYLVPAVGNFLVPAFNVTNKACQAIADFSKNTFTKFVSLFKKKKSE